MNGRSRFGQTLTEVMLATIFLATGGLVIYQASTNMMKTEAWKSERVFAQGALRDLVEVFSVFDYCELQVSVAKKINLTDNEDNVIEQALKDQAMQDSFEAESGHFSPLKFESFFLMGDKDKPIVKSKSEMDVDAVYRAYIDTKKRIDLRRAVVFKDEAGARAIVVCAVEFTATTGQKVRLKMPFVVFNTLGGPCGP